MNVGFTLNSLICGRPLSSTTNPALRMARQLLKLEVNPSYDDLFFADGKEVIELQTHDDEFLPLMKEMFPA